MSDYDDIVNTYLLLSLQNRHRFRNLDSQEMQTLHAMLASLCRDKNARSVDLASYVLA
jgi:hypothetical protein